MAESRDFYDGLAAGYHLLFDDWWTAAQEHGEVIGALLASRGVQPPASVLDCTCGIGTQALPLAAAGYRVTGTDLSDAAIERARAERDARGLHATFLAADVRTVDRVLDQRFDAVVSCDNALPHLLTDTDLHQALASIRGCLHEDGLLVASVRDYDALVAERPAGTPMVVHGRVGGRHASGQTWVWSDDGRYVDITSSSCASGRTASGQDRRTRPGTGRCAALT